MPHDDTDPKFYFRDWMNRLHLKAEAVAGPFGITPQTVRHWRSKGVPAGRQDFVARTIAEWTTGAALGPRLHVQASDEQFRAWSEAALARKRILEDWVREGLDELAKEYFSTPRTSPLRALPPATAEEESPPYSATN